MTDVEAQRLITCVVTAFPATLARLTPDQQRDTQAIYRRMLADLDYPAANAAIERLLATAKFMPTVAEIREATLAIESGEQKPGGEAWGEVLKAVSVYGSYRTPGVEFTFSDPVTARCVDSLGWSSLCLSENTVADRARFIELYDKQAAQSRRKQLSESLPAMQRFRAIEAEKRTAQLEQGSGSIFGKVLSLAMGSDDV
jgi:hypothetical protein